MTVGKAAVAAQSFHGEVLARTVVQAVQQTKLAVRAKAAQIRKLAYLSEQVALTEGEYRAAKKYRQKLLDDVVSHPADRQPSAAERRRHYVFRLMNS